MIREVQYHELTSGYPLFSNFTPRLRSTFQTEAWPVHFPKDRVLFDIGWNCRVFILVTSGSYRVFTYQDSRELQLYVVRQGDCCMMSTICLLGATDHLSCGITEEALDGVAISRDLFTHLVAEAPEFREFTFRCFSARVNRLLSIIQELAFHTLEQRLAAQLLAKGEWIPLTHQRLADEIGSVREVVSRNLKEFEARGILRLERGQIHVLNRDALEKVLRHEID